MNTAVEAESGQRASQYYTVNAVPVGHKIAGETSSEQAQEFTARRTRLRETRNPLDSVELMPRGTWSHLLTQLDTPAGNALYTTTLCAVHKKQGEQQRI